MKKLTIVAALAAAAIAALVAVQLAAGGAGGALAAGGAGGLRPDGQSPHGVNPRFDNTHHKRHHRDNADVASDLEQMPHLLDFLKNKGTLFTNDHTILISHTAGGILSSLTGLYPDRQGQTVSNSYDYFDAAKVPHFTSSFKYWTNPVDPSLDT